MVGNVAVGIGFAAGSQPVESTCSWDASRGVSVSDSAETMLTSSVKLVYDAVQKSCETFCGSLGVRPEMQHVLQTFRAFED